MVERHDARQGWPGPNGPVYGRQNHQTPQNHKTPQISQQTAQIHPGQQQGRQNHRDLQNHRGPQTYQGYQAYQPARTPARYPWPPETGNRPVPAEYRAAYRDGFGRRRRPDASAWHWLLLIPIVLPLLTPLYNRTEPTLLGLPFFYWCQFGFAVISSVVVAVVHLGRKGR